MPFSHQRCILLVFFSACAQQGSMLTLASSSRVPFPTSTNVQWSIGIFFCPSWGLGLTFFFRLAPRSIKKTRPWTGPWCSVLGLLEWEFFSLPSLFSWNSWIPISREFSIANFKSYGDYRSLDSSIAWFVDRLIRSLDSSIAKIRIPSIATIQNSVDHEDTRFRRSRRQKFPEDRNSDDREDKHSVDREKFENLRWFFIRKANLHLLLPCKKNLEDVVGISTRRSRYGYLKIVT